MTSAFEANMCLTENITPFISHSLVFFIAYLTCISPYTIFHLAVFEMHTNGTILYVIVWVSLKAGPERRTWVQVVYFGGDPRKQKCGDRGRD